MNEQEIVLIISIIICLVLGFVIIYSIIKQYKLNNEIIRIDKLIKEVQE